MIVNKPIGSVKINIGDREHYFTNMFTQYAFEQFTKPGTTEIYNRSDMSASPFKYCHIGDGLTPLNPDSTGLGNVTHSIELNSHDAVYLNNNAFVQPVYDIGGLYKNHKCNIYRLILNYTFEPVTSGDITELMLSATNDNTGMICGLQLGYPVSYSSGESVTVEYTVTFNTWRYGNQYGGMNNAFNVANGDCTISISIGREITGYDVNYNAIPNVLTNTFPYLSGAEESPVTLDSNYWNGGLDGSNATGFITTELIGYYKRKYHISYNRILTSSVSGSSGYLSHTPTQNSNHTCFQVGGQTFTENGVTVGGYLTGNSGGQVSIDFEYTIEWV